VLGMHRHAAIVGALLAILGGCAVEAGDETNEVDPSETDGRDYAQYDKHGPSFDPCAEATSLTVEGFAVDLPVACNPYWVDRGDPPDEISGAETAAALANPAPGAPAD
jgi:hypothetical protein